MSDAVAPDEQGSRRFHIALAGVFAFFLSPFVSWGAFWLQRKAAPGPWRARLFALALFDTLVFACFMAVAAGAAKPPAHPPAAAARPRIGVELTPVEPADGVEVARVTAGSPADGAGLREGDRVTAIDESPVRDNAGFRRIIAETPPGASRTLRVRRGASEFDSRVTPAADLRSPPGPARPLFEPAPGQPSLLKDSFLRSSGLYLAGLLAPALLAAAARRRGVRGRAAGRVMLALGASAAMTFVALAAFEKIIGLSLGALLVSQLLGSLAMMALAWLFVRGRDRGRAAGPPPASSRPPLGGLSAFGLGLFYALAATARASILVAALSLTPRVPHHSSFEVFGVSPAFGAYGLLLFGLAAVVVAPIAEECLFRGVLLPWLTTWVRPTAAVFLSALSFGAGHLAYGSGVLIPIALGLSLGWVRLRSGGLRAGIALHMLWNGAVLANLWLSSPR